MAQIIREITIDVSQPNNLRAITAKQNDLNSRYLKIHITDEGTPIIVSLDSKVVMNVKRTDNTLKMFYGSVNDDGSITVPLTSWMLALPGSINCDVSIISPEDKQRLSTMQFSLYVEAAVFPQSDLEETEDYDVLVELLGAAEKTAECVAATEEAEEAAERANAAAAGVVIVEQNSTSPLTFWVGTQEEYDAIVNKDKGCFYIISDDTDLQEIYNRINAVHTEMLNYHTPYDISSAVTVERSTDSCTLYKCGKFLTLTLNRGGNVTYSDRPHYSCGADVLIATIHGYAPVQTIVTPSRMVKTGSGGEDLIALKLEPDDTGKNTLIKNPYDVSTIRTSGADAQIDMVTFMCK